MSLKVYINGEILPQEDAKISVFDHGLLYGDGANANALLAGHSMQETASCVWQTKIPWNVSHAFWVIQSSCNKMAFILI